MSIKVPVPPPPRPSWEKPRIGNRPTGQIHLLHKIYNESIRLGQLGHNTWTGRVEHTQRARGLHCSHGSLLDVHWRVAYLKPCSRRIQNLTECVKLQPQKFQRPVENVFKTLRIWGAIKTFWWHSIERSWRHIVDDYKSYDLKLRWRRFQDEGFFNLEKTFWWSTKHFHLSHLKAL